MYTCLANSLYLLLLIHYRDIINHEHDMVIMLPIGLCFNNVCLLFYCQSFIFYLWEWPCLYLQTHAGMEWLWVWGINCRVASGDFWILPQVSQSQIDTDHLKVKQQLTYFNKSAITPRNLNKSHFIFIFFCKYTYKHNMSLRCMYKPQNFKNFRFLVLQYLLWTASIWSTFNLIVTVQIFSQAYLALVLWGHRSVIPWSLPDWMLEYHQRGPVKHDINWGIRTNKIVVARIL